MPDAPDEYLLDTNILVEYLRGRELGRAIENRYALCSAPFRPFVCVVSVGEIRTLADIWGWGDNKLRAMEDLLDELAWVDISSEAVIDAYVEVARYCLKGNVMQQNDMWIAAAARALGVCLLTTDTDFQRLPDELLRCDLIPRTLGRSEPS